MSFGRGRGHGGIIGTRLTVLHIIKKQVKASDASQRLKRKGGAGRAHQSSDKKLRGGDIWIWDAEVRQEELKSRALTRTGKGSDGSRAYGMGGEKEVENKMGEKKRTRRSGGKSNVRNATHC